MPALCSCWAAAVNGFKGFIMFLYYGICTQIIFPKVALCYKQFSVMARLKGGGLFSLSLSPFFCVDETVLQDEGEDVPSVLCAS